VPKEDNVVLSQDDVALLVNWAGKPMYYVAHRGYKLCNHCMSPYGEHVEGCDVANLQTLLERIRTVNTYTYSIEKG
jgi:hypothetical protein